MNCHELLHAATRMNMKGSINYMIQARKNTMPQSLGYVLPRTTAPNKFTAALLQEMQQPLLPKAQ